MTKKGGQYRQKRAGAAYKMFFIYAVEQPNALFDDPASIFGQLILTGVIKYL